MATKKQLSINKLQLGLLSYPATDNVGDSLLDYSIQNDNRKKDFTTDNQFKNKQTPLHRYNRNRPESRRR